MIISSTALCELLSLSGPQLKGLNIIDLFHPSERDRIKNEIGILNLEPDKTSGLFLTGITRDGRQIPLSVTFSLVQNIDGRFLLIFEDKSEEQREQNKIEKLEHQAAIGTFTSSVAHEFNNVLTGIRGYAQLAKTDISDKALIAKAFNIIEQETIRGAELCKNLSLYSGNKKLSLEPVMIKEIIMTAIDLQSRYLMSDNIQVITDIPDLPPVLVDRFKLQQVILNLLINARHAIIPKGSGSIDIHASIDGEMVEIKVSDTGTGIEPHNITRIFDPFYTSKNTLGGVPSGGTSIRGTGLGLSVCKTIIEQHGGTLDVASQTGIGTAFTARIPFRIAERRAQAPASALPLPPNTRKKPPHILVVD
ncbi:MAG: two-component system sensor histidine kinase NtrB, partial [Spirochaetota bacterium]